jgi:hypothetical protein
MKNYLPMKEYVVKMYDETQAFQQTIYLYAQDDEEAKRESLRRTIDWLLEGEWGSGDVVKGSYRLYDPQEKDLIYQDDVEVVA